MKKVIHIVVLVLFLAQAEGLLTVYLTQLHYRRSTRAERVLLENKRVVAFHFSDTEYKQALNAEGEIEAGGELYDVCRTEETPNGILVYGVRDTRDEHLLRELKDVLIPFGGQGKTPSKSIRWVQQDFLPSSKIGFIVRPLQSDCESLPVLYPEFILHGFDEEINPPPPRTA